MVWIGGRVPTDSDVSRVVAGLFLGPVVRGGIYLYTATHTGLVTITLRILERPVDLDEDAWEDVASMSVTFDDPELQVVPLGGEGSLLSAGIPGAGLYRLRAASRARQESDLVSETGHTEEYLVDIWPEENEKPPLAEKLTSRFAASLSD